MGESTADTDYVETELTIMDSDTGDDDDSGQNGSNGSEDGSSGNGDNGDEEEIKYPM
jgi:hypothetical protein